MAMTITPEEMREMIERLEKEAEKEPIFESNPPQRTATYYLIKDASAMLRSIAAEREELRQLLFDIHPDPDHDVVQKYYAYFEATPIPKGAA